MECTQDTQDRQDRQVFWSCLFYFGMMTKFLVPFGPFGGIDRRRRESMMMMLMIMITGILSFAHPPGKSSRGFFAGQLGKAGNKCLGCVP